MLAHPVWNTSSSLSDPVFDFHPPTTAYQRSSVEVQDGPRAHRFEWSDIKRPPKNEWPEICSKIMVTGIFFIAPKRGSQELDNLYAELTMPTGCIPLGFLFFPFSNLTHVSQIKVGPSLLGVLLGETKKKSVEN